MLLSTSTYFLFLGALFFLYWPLTRWRLATLATLLFANYFFYAKWDLFYLGLIPLCSSADFLVGLALGKAKGKAARLALVSASIALNIGILAAFKYMPLFLETWAALFGGQVIAWPYTFPLGISFYAFQSLTYTIDIYRKDAKPTSSLLAHLTATSLFPTILAGPITRVPDLLKQLEKFPKQLTATAGGQALYWIGLGLMKKLLIADYLSENLVNRVFDFPTLYSGAEVLVGVYAYALQLYYDFSGYTDIARGSAQLLGLQLPANFNRPYGAVNINDFWRRWHISLSNWLRDYLFFSLPGKRSSWAPYLNLIVTMALGGLWHGASWNFLIWGLLHGAAQAVSRGWQQWRGPKTPARTPEWFRAFFTVQFVCFAWIFFRAESLERAQQILGQIASGTLGTPNVSTPLWFVLGLAVAAHYLPANWTNQPRERFGQLPFPVQAALLLGLVIAIQYVAATGAAPFLYTQF